MGGRRPKFATLAVVVPLLSILHLFAVVATSTTTASFQKQHQELHCWTPETAEQALAASPLSFTTGNTTRASSPLPPHPRLRLNDTQLAILNKTIYDDATANAYFRGLVGVGETMLTQAPVNCDPHADLLAAARTTLSLEYALGLLWRLTGDDRYAARATAELIHVTHNCTTWDPFGLVLSEMTHAVGIGYDWFYKYLNAEQRVSISSGAARLGLAEALREYAAGVFWTNCTFNWGIVTNGGLTVGALGLYEAIPENASRVLAQAAARLPCGFTSFAPQGGWHEGPMYWQYVAEYSHAVIESLISVYGDDRGLSSMPGYNETGLFRLHLNGPSQTPFDFGDSETRLYNNGASYFMGYAKIPTTDAQRSALFAYQGRRLARSIAGYAVNASSFSPPTPPPQSHAPLPAPSTPNTLRQAERYNCSMVDCARLLLEYSAAGNSTTLEAEPTGRVFKMGAFEWGGHRGVGSFRSGWASESDGLNGTQTWLAFKAANGVPNHNDVDGGTFVLEMGGRRFVSDMGSDNYDLPDYWTQTRTGRYRWYRKSTPGHNTLTFDNDGINHGACSQDPSSAGVTGIELFRHNAVPKNSSAGPLDYAIVDLTAAYADLGAARVSRGFAYTKGHKTLVIVDEFEHDTASNITWALHTQASVSVEMVKVSSQQQLSTRRKAKLTMDGVSLTAVLHEVPNDGKFSAVAVNLTSPQYPSDGFTRLQVQAKLKAASSGDTTTTNSKPYKIVVALSLDPNAAASIPTLNPLNSWVSRGPFRESVLPHLS